VSEEKEPPPLPGVYSYMCIFGISRLYSTCIPPVSHHILGIPLYPCIYLHLAISQQIHGIPLLYASLYSICICIQSCQLSAVFVVSSIYSC